MALNSEKASVYYWLQGGPAQNFGDYISEYLLEKALIAPRVLADRYRLLGSAIHGEIIRDDLQECNGRVLAYWGCGLRDEKPIAAEWISKVRLFGVRGPLTREALGLPHDTALGDPGLLIPIIYPAKPSEKTTGKTICVPHFNDRKSDDKLRTLSGAEMVVRPNIASNISALEKIFDHIASASFVLAGSLHGAILAHAYGVPYGFWDNGFMDIPFKWRDFAASVNTTACFVSNLEEGKKIYNEIVAPKIKSIPLLPLVQVCPFFVRPSFLMEVAARDGVASPDQSKKYSALFDFSHVTINTLDDARRLSISLHRPKMRRIREIVANEKRQKEHAEEHSRDLAAIIEEREQTIKGLEQNIASIYASSSWKFSAPVRALSGLARRGKSNS